MTTLDVQIEKCIQAWSILEAGNFVHLESDIYPFVFKNGITSQVRFKLLLFDIIFLERVLISGVNISVKVLTTKIKKVLNNTNNKLSGQQKLKSF